MNRTSTDNRGFTLIEVLVGAALLAIVAVATLSMTIMVIKGNQRARYHSLAVQLAEQGIETLKRVNYSSQLPSYDGLVEDYDTITNFNQFRRIFSVQISSDMATLTVSVTWRTQGGTSQPVVLKTFRSED